MPDFALIAADIARAYQPPHTGSLSRIGEADTVQELLEAIDDGNYIETAAELAGISKVTVYDWMRRGEAGEIPFNIFASAIKRAAARAEAAEVKKVRTAGEDPRFWAASMTYLERRHPDRWARRSEDSNSPKVIVQIGGNVTDVKLLTVSDAGNHNAAYQTQTLDECEQSQALPAPYPGATEAKD